MNSLFLISTSIFVNFKCYTLKFYSFSSFKELLEIFILFVKTLGVYLLDLIWSYSSDICNNNLDYFISPISNLFFASFSNLLNYSFSIFSFLNCNSFYWSLS